MAYSSMKKLIQNEIQKYNQDEISTEEFDMWKKNSANKLDVFLTCNRITEAQYQELMSMLYPVVEQESES